MLPKLLGAGLKGMGSVGGAIQKSVRTGSQAIGALALSQTEPEVLAAMAGGKKLLSKINLTRRSPQAEPSSLEPEVMDSAISMPTDSPLAGLQQAIEGVGESITNRLSSLETRLSDMADDVFSLNFTTDIISTVLEEISTTASGILGSMPDLESRRESSRRRRTEKSRPALTRADGTTASGGGGSGMMSMLGLLPLLGILGSVAAAIAPIAVPLVGVVSGLTALIAFLNSDLADDIRDSIANALFDPEEELNKLNKSTAAANKILLETQNEAKDHYNSLSKKDQTAVDEFEKDSQKMSARTAGSEVMSTKTGMAIDSGNAAVMEQQQIKVAGRDREMKVRNDEIYYDDSFSGRLKSIANAAFSLTPLGRGMDALTVAKNFFTGEDLRTDTGAAALAFELGIGPDADRLAQSTLETGAGGNSISPLADSTRGGSQQDQVDRLGESIQQITTNNNTTIVNPTEPKSPTTDGPIGTPTGRATPVY